MAISDKIFKNYLKCGLLMRTNDGQLPITLKGLKKAIGNIVLDESKISPNSEKALNLGGYLPNNGPTYSATLLSRNNYPVLWYYYRYSDPFNKHNPAIGNRTNLVVVFKPTRIYVSGMCLWDADSNNRNTGVVPNNATANKTTSKNNFTDRKIFNRIGNYKYEGPKSLNSHAWYNPLIRPRTVESIAKTKKEICSFLKQGGELKEYWVNHLRDQAGGFNDKWAKYISDTYGSGVESEILTTPIYNPRSIYGSLKFSIDDIVSMAFVTDGSKHSSASSKKYKKAVRSFFGYESGNQKNPDTPGWIQPTKLMRIDQLPIISITNVALPNVEIDSTNSSNVGHEWIEYLKHNRYQEPLTSDDFKTISEGKR